VSLITVAGGLRSSGVLDGSGVQLEIAREVMINHGLFTLKTKGVWSKTEIPKEYLQPELFVFKQCCESNCSHCAVVLAFNVVQ
jgi:hypothetical protein